MEDLNAKVKNAGFKPSNEKSNGAYPTGYLDGGYFDKDGNDRPALVLNGAEKIAEVIRIIDVPHKKPKKMGTSQIRKFYDSLCNTVSDLDRHNITTEQAIYEVAQLKAYASASLTKENASLNFYKFIQDNVEAVRKAGTAEAVKAFKRHFEAVVCYYSEKK